jgi:hypothetical protein
MRTFEAMKNPIQPLYVDDKGVLRFKPNAIVQYLLDKGGLDLNMLAGIEGVSQTDWEQFHMLIGYSLSGFGELSSTSDETYEAADALSQDGALNELEVRNRILCERIKSMRGQLREGIALLYGIHPDDLPSEQ